MRCLACNRVLNDYEATRRFSESREFVDLCNHCFYSGVADDINFEERQDLEEVSDELC